MTFQFEIDDVLLKQIKALPTLLIVDDQSLILHSLYQLFRDDYEVLVATSGLEAIEICESQAPDLILLDLLMPGMDGYDTCEHLKKNEHTRHIPILFVTADRDSEEETRCLDAGAVDFIFKPVNPRVVKAKVHTHTRLKLQTDFLRKIACLDGLTGIANRRLFDDTLQKEWRLCQRKGLPLSLIYIDVDYFKRYNDFYGHLQGDSCLQAVANSLNTKIKRPSDLLARIGGEEFACLLPDTPIEGAYAIAQEFEAGVRKLAIPHVTSDVICPDHSSPAQVVTISLGVTSLVPSNEKNSTELLGLADQLLYLAKLGGRGRIVAASP